MVKVALVLALLLAPFGPRQHEGAATTPLRAPNGQILGIGVAAVNTRNLVPGQLEGWGGVDFPLDNTFIKFDYVHLYEGGNLVKWTSGPTGWMPADSGDPYQSTAWFFCSQQRTYRTVVRARMKKGHNDPGPWVRWDSQVWEATNFCAP